MKRKGTKEEKMRVEKKDMKLKESNFVKKMKKNKNLWIKKSEESVVEDLCERQV